ncbi:hypothetical protein KC336_g19625 [Hortaea werneckii]|nr:hypothetical protein KC336_g19625 [Hortaea werneckii]
MVEAFGLMSRGDRGFCKETGDDMMAREVQVLDEAVVVISDDDEEQSSDVVRVEKRKSDRPANIRQQSNQDKQSAMVVKTLTFTELDACEQRSKAAHAQINSLQYLELSEKHYAAKALALEGCDDMYEPENRPDPRSKPRLPDRAELCRNPMAYGLYTPTWPLNRVTLGLLRQEKLQYDPMSPEFLPGIVEHLTVEHPESAWADVEPTKYEPDLREVLKGAGELDELEEIRRQCEDDYSPK